MLIRRQATQWAAITLLGHFAAVNPVCAAIVHSPFEISFSNSFVRGSNTPLSDNVTFNYSLGDSSANVVESAAALATGPTATSFAAGTVTGMPNPVGASSGVYYNLSIANANPLDLTSQPVDVSVLAIGSASASDATAGASAAAQAWFTVAGINAYACAGTGYCGPSNAGSSFNVNQMLSLKTNVVYPVAISTYANLRSNFGISYAGSAAAMVDPLFSLTPEEMAFGYKLTVSSYIDQQAPAVPEPAGWMLMCAGIAWVAARHRRSIA